MLGEISSTLTPLGYPLPLARTRRRVQTGDVDTGCGHAEDADADGTGVRIKRAYEPAEPGDGCRVLVDRLWPRGVSKERAALDRWEKEVAPSNELRREWHADPRAHEPDRFAAFAERYRSELAEPPAAEALDRLVGLARAHERLTLLYGARDERANHAVVLRDALRQRLDAAG